VGARSRGVESGSSEAKRVKTFLGMLHWGLRFDSSGKAYVTGITHSLNFPIRFSRQEHPAGNSSQALTVGLRLYSPLSRELRPVPSVRQYSTTVARASRITRGRDLIMLRF
jgi:hypothetical protein